MPVVEVARKPGVCLADRVVEFVNDVRIVGAIKFPPV